MTKSASRLFTQLVVAVIILLTVYIIIYPPDVEFFRKTSEFAVQLMLGLLGLGFVFLLFRQERLMFISMIASGFLAFYLKTASNTNMVLPQVNNLPKLTVAHFNLSSFDAYDPEFHEVITALGSDIISFQEYTPDWNAYIKQKLLLDYKYSYSNVRMDLFGMAVFSKVPFKDINTFVYKDIPNLDIKINTGYQDVNIISSHIAPPSLRYTKFDPGEHLETISEHVRSIENPVLVVGDFNQVYWTNDIQDFRLETEMKNSRRNVELTTKAPYDHIFYTPQLECIDFQEVKNKSVSHLGKKASFQPSS